MSRIVSPGTSDKTEGPLTPASSSRTCMLGSSDSRLATTHPALPAPTITTSAIVSVTSFSHQRQNTHAFQQQPDPEAIEHAPFDVLCHRRPGEAQHERRLRCQLPRYLPCTQQCSVMANHLRHETQAFRLVCTDLLARE